MCINVDYTLDRCLRENVNCRNARGRESLLVLDVNDTNVKGELLAVNRMLARNMLPTVAFEKC